MKRAGCVFSVAVVDVSVLKLAVSPTAVRGFCLYLARLEKLVTAVFLVVEGLLPAKRDLVFPGSLVS